jgi:predicted anti-sigma-YlaC factor YlaD
MKEVFALDCRFFREQIVIESYEELETEAKQSLEAHLQTCRECEQFQVSLNETQQALDQWTEADRPIDIEALHGAIQSKP